MAILCSLPRADIIGLRLLPGLQGVFKVCECVCLIFIDLILWNLLHVSEEHVKHDIAIEIISIIFISR